MRVSISNIAWDSKQDKEVANVLRNHEIDAIDVAHSKYFPDLNTVSDNDIQQVRNWWNSQQIQIVGMQALLYGSKPMNLFADQASRRDMLTHFNQVCNLGRALGATRLVFGSPKARDKLDHTEKAALDIAHDFFYQLGEIAINAEVTICLEPNPSCYGANFMLTSDETARVVEHVNHPAIQMQFDTGASTINNEKVDDMLSRYKHLIGHIHISEAQLAPLGEGSTDHLTMAQATKKYLPEHIVTIEMLNQCEENTITKIRNAILLAQEYYG